MRTIIATVNAPAPSDRWQAPYQRRYRGRDQRGRTNSETPKERVELDGIAEHTKPNRLVNDPSHDNDRQGGGKWQYRAGESCECCEWCRTRKCKAC
jgi:hypothetical protein